MIAANPRYTAARTTEGGTALYARTAQSETEETLTGLSPEGTFPSLPRSP
ncbi:hypothetical protein [Streptomyces sp. 4N124]